LVTATSPLD